MVSQSAQKFNEHLDHSLDLQAKLSSIKSPLDLINLAKEEGFELSIEDFQEIAQNAYQKWLAKLNSPTAIFFEKVHLNPELNHKLHQCKSKDDVISLAHECGLQINSLTLQMAAKAAESIPGFSFEKLFFRNLDITK